MEEGRGWEGRVSALRTEPKLIRRGAGLRRKEERGGGGWRLQRRRLGREKENGRRERRRRRASIWKVEPWGSTC